MKSITIGVIEEESTQTSSLINAIKADSRFNLSFYISNTNRAEAIIAEEKPDVLILNYESRGVSSTELLRRISANNSSDKPYIILSTCISGDILKGYAGLYGVNDIIVKPYTAVDAFDRLLYLYSFLNDCCRDNFLKREMSHYHHGFKLCEHNRIRKGREELQMITGVTFDMLIESQMPIGNFGFAFIIEAIRQLYYMDLYEMSVMKVLYHSIAELYEVSAKAVEKSIRTAISAGWNSSSEGRRRNDFINVFDRFNEKPSNKELLMYTTICVRKILNDAFI